MSEEDRRQEARQSFSGDGIGVADDGRITTAESGRRAWQVVDGLAARPLDGMRREAAPEHAQGTLIGLAVGDALGTTLEFQAIAAPPFPQLATGPHHSVTGGGPFALNPGQVTDDTQMACALLESLVQKNWFTASDAARRYIEWSKWAFDIGGQTSAALGEIASGALPAVAGKTVWEQRGKDAAGNGSLMRTAPIGVVFSADGLLRREASVNDSASTHFDPRCQLACAAYNGAIARAVRGDSVPATAILDAAESELAAASWYLVRTWPDIKSEIEIAFMRLSDDLAAARGPDPGLYTDELHLHRHQGFVRVAFRLALWELVHAPSFEAGLVDVVNRGGDADTNGAIAGALLGAYHGFDAIPRGWVDPVMRALPEDPENPLTREYHPRILRDLIDRIYAAPGAEDR